MHRQHPIKSALTLAAIVACGLAARTLAAAEPTPSSAGWPQWRGPTRDGIAPPGPKLLDAWPKEGPPRVWKSDFIRAVHVEGGMSSVVVSEGKVLVYVHARGTGKPVKLITAEVLKHWGWEAGMPEELVTKLEKARATKDKRMKPGIRLNAYIATFLATLDPALAAQYGDAIRNRLTNGVKLKPRESHETWSSLPTLKDTLGFTKMLDKEYTSVEECWKDINKHVGMGHKDDSWMFTQMMAEAFPPHDTVICLDAANGKQLWRKDFPGFCKLGMGFQFWSASATPAISGGRCYVQGSAGFYCLDLKDGAVVWKSNSEFSHSSPLVLNGKVYSMTPWLTAFDASTGRILWLQEKGPASFDATSVMPWTHEGKLSLITLGQGNAPYGIDPETGKVLWETAKYRTDSAETPVLVGDVLLAGRKALKLTPQGGEKLWAVSVGGDRGASVTYYQGHVYAHTGRGPYCFDFKTGEQKWKGHGNYSGECFSPVVADGKFIGFCGADGTQEVVMYKASPEKFEELGKFKLNVTYATSPAIVGGKLFVRLEDGVACYDLEKHAP